MAILNEIERDEVKANLKRVIGDIDKTVSQLKTQVQQHVTQLQAMAQSEHLSNEDKAEVQSVINGLTSKIDTAATDLKSRIPSE